MSWRLLPAPGLENLPWDAEAAAAALLDSVATPSAVLRDDRRSRVLRLDQPPAGWPPELVRLAPPPWVCKRPLWRDLRAWNRLVSWFTPGEMARAFRGGLALLEAGVATPRPLLLLERRQWGMLVESWLVYGFLEGTAVEERHWPLVVEALRRIHRAGMRHGDPHLANWLATSQGVAALDPGPRPLRPGHADDAYDFVLLRNCQPLLAPLLPGTDTPAWRQAEARNARVQGWRRFKRRLRRRDRATPA